METVKCGLCHSDDYSMRYHVDGYQVVQCRQCGLVYVNPRHSEDELKAFYESSYYDYYLQPSKLELEKWRILLSNIKKMKGEGNLLDVGCNAGIFLNLARDYYEISGVEISKRACEQAKKLHGLNVFNGSLEDADFPEEHFDVVVAVEVIEHLHHPEEFIKEISRILKKGGVLFLSTGNIDSWNARFKGSKWWYLEPKYHLNYFSRKTIVNFLKPYFQVVNFSGNLGLNIFDIYCAALKARNFRAVCKDTLARLTVGNRQVGSSLSVYAKKN